MERCDSTRRKRTQRDYKLAFKLLICSDLTYSSSDFSKSSDAEFIQ